MEWFLKMDRVQIKEKGVGRYTNERNNVAFKLDLSNACLYCKINNQDYQLLIDDVDRDQSIRYTLGVSIGSALNSVTLIDYQCIDCK